MIESNQDYSNASEIEKVITRNQSVCAAAVIASVFGLFVCWIPLIIEKWKNITSYCPNCKSGSGICMQTFTRFPFLILPTTAILFFIFQTLLIYLYLNHLKTENDDPLGKQYT